MRKCQLLYHCSNQLLKNIQRSQDLNKFFVVKAAFQYVCAEGGEIAVWKCRLPGINENFLRLDIPGKMFRNASHIRKASYFLQQDLGRTVKERKHPELSVVTCTRAYISKHAVSGERSPLFISPLHPGG